MKKDIFSEAEELVMPGFGGTPNPGEYDIKKYTVKYLKANVDDLTHLQMLSEIETRGVRNDGIVLLDKDKFVFMDQYFIILHYLEANTRATT